MEIYHISIEIKCFLNYSNKKHKTCTIMSKKKNKKKKKIVASEGVPQEPKKVFNCLRCGYCCICSTPSFTKEEYKRVRDLKITKERKVEFKKVDFGVITDKYSPNYLKRQYSYFTLNGLKTLSCREGDTPPPCEFLDKDEEGKHSCAIYAFRPSVCRDFGVKEWECPNNPGFLKAAK
jgi:Fe-S-cluster containining protein